MIYVDARFCLQWAALQNVDESLLLISDLRFMNQASFAVTTKHLSYSKHSDDFRHFCPAGSYQIVASGPQASKFCFIAYKFRTEALTISGRPTYTACIKYNDLGREQRVYTLSLLNLIICEFTSIHKYYFE